MLTSITPLGERSRNRNWGPTVTAYLAGSLAGGAAMGLAFGGLGAVLPTLPNRIAALVTITILVAVVAAESGLLAVRPIGERQVNEDWLDEYRGWVVGLGFGFQLGLGLVTVVTSLTVPATFLLAALTGSWKWGIAIGATFGFARAVPVLSARSVGSPGQLAALHRRHDAAGQWARFATAAAAVPLAMLVAIA